MNQVPINNHKSDEAATEHLTSFINFSVAHEQTSTCDNHLCNERMRRMYRRNQRITHYHRIIFASLDGVDAASFALVALLEKNCLRPKKTRMGTLLKSLKYL